MHLKRAIIGLPMKILNKAVSKEFESFYEDTVAHIGMQPNFQRNPPHGLLGSFCLEAGVPVIRLSTNMNKPSFEYIVAHELCHALQRMEGWPTIESRLDEKSPMAQIGRHLATLVLDLDVGDRLKDWPSNLIWLHAQYRNLRKAVLDQNVPQSGSYEWRKGAMMYASASLTQPLKKWNGLKELFLNRAPHIAEKGEELASILMKLGWQKADRALHSLIAIRDSLDLPSDQLTILDTKTEKRY